MDITLLYPRSRGKFLIRSGCRMDLFSYIPAFIVHTTLILVSMGRHGWHDPWGMGSVQVIGGTNIL
ncbi:hypothetical protein BDV38DRAFT_243015 [Aspergillus pseudotamarii]|uniref:Uncharacterized protein n=1 Tax=Aspergillus pseudotamarii TaxID=132259 RepID=A0A5N6SX79_ASPPS|nr:uncharacterized protein BDV38DRAFT_243015 [Aspergillus pseudotamarii]KAE8139212.1 hypothetical protein BDV38DRAFT_243015 [Aspergillus pseudotamarii]